MHIHTHIPCTLCTQPQGAPLGGVRVTVEGKVVHEGPWPDKAQMQEIVGHIKAEMEA